MPADRGLSGLGLLMQLFGSVFAALTSVILIVVLITAGRARGGGNEMLWVLLLCGTGITRSLLHRAAGAELLYGTGNVFGGIKKYFIAAMANTVVWLFVLSSQMHAPAAGIIPMLLALVAWPIALVVVASMPAYRAMADKVPTGEDKGFEGASILMLVFGLLGVIFMSLMLYVTWTSARGGMKGSLPFMMMMLAMILLVIRSGIHVGAGLTGLRETRFDLVVASANRYADFGVIATFIAAGAICLTIMMGAPDPTVFAVMACMVWALLAWPLTIRKFFSERQFADLMAQTRDEQQPHHRAPDLGLTSLGWLLFAQALLSISFALPTALLAPGNGAEAMSMRGNPFGELTGLLGAQMGHSPWWGVGLAALQLWAAIELVRMSELHRIAASAFGALAAAVTLYFDWPLISHLGSMRGGDLPGSTMIFAMVAMQLTIPVATLVLVNRNPVPAATARFTGAT
ncbi:MAG TPA: hypothetical protein VL463_04415 [Kofleriaceae bacterium]|nr:hypothetical protein [Kofleriaceae bacterium]